jgi:2-iminoacetate synthase
MELAKPGDIHAFCRPNAILTLTEYLEDYGTEELKELGEKVIAKYFDQIEEEKLKKETAKRIKQIKEEGKRDLYF